MLRLLLAHYNQSSSDALIAQAIAFGIEEQLGTTAAVTVERMTALSQIGDYDAFVIGTNLEEGRWPTTTRRFLARNAPALSRKPTAIYLALTSRMDSQTDGQVRDALANDQTRQFVAQRMPMQIEPNHLRGIGLFTSIETFGANRVAAWLRAIYAKVLRASRVDDEYAVAGRRFGNRIGARFEGDID